MAKTPAKKSKPTPAAKPATARVAKSRATPLAGYLVLARGKPLVLSHEEGSPKGGILDRNEQGTLFARLNAAQAAIKRTVKHQDGKPKALTVEGYVIIRVDQPPNAA